MHRRACIGVALGVFLLGVFLINPISKHFGTENADFRGIALAGEAVAFDCQFGDIGDHPWGADVMREMVRLGILQGYPGQVADTYGYPTKYFAEPEKAISRAEFATLLARSLNLPPKETNISFGDWWDVPDWAKGAVAALFDRGIVEGVQGADGNMYFLPSREITRAEIAVMVMRALNMEAGIKGGEPGGFFHVTDGDANEIAQGASNGAASNGVSASNPFRDVCETDWFYEGVLSAYRRGIVNGRTDTSFFPAMNAKRVEVMAVLHRILEKDRSFSPSDEELIGLVSDYYGRAENFLKGRGGKELRAILTGAAAYSFNTGGVGVLESTPLPGDITIRIIPGDGGSTVVSKSGRLASVLRDTVIYLEPENETTPRLRVSVQEEFGLFCTNAGWKIYSVEVKASKTTEMFE